MSSDARLRITFHLSDAAAEWAGSALTDLFPEGLLLVSLPGGVTRLQGWLKGAAARSAARARQRLEALGATRLSERLQAPSVLAPPKHGRFPALRLGRFLVLPAGSDAQARIPKGAWPIFLIQGQAFGSGRHESTRLMIQSITQHPPQGGEVLDVGAGSGILGFACLKLGASRVTSVELESAACAELRRNRGLNSVSPGRMPVVCGGFPLKRLRIRRYPLVLANIITPVLVALMPQLAAQVAPEGALLCGGIHTDAEARVVIAAARARGLVLKRRSQLRQWNVLRFSRP